MQNKTLSTSCNSWHNMSRATWQLKATFATSQSCRKRAIVSPHPCSPTTNNTSLPTLFSLELHDDTEEQFPDRPEIFLNHHVQTDQGTCFSLLRLGCWPNPNQLSVYLPGTFLCVDFLLRRTLSHATRKGQRTSLPTTVESDLTPPGRRSPCFHKTSSQLQY